MKTCVLMLSSLSLLAGCAARAPVAGMERGANAESGRSELEMCQAARAFAERRGTEKDVIIWQLEEQLKGHPRPAEQAPQAVAETGAELANCRGELAALKQKETADTDACMAACKELRKQADTGASGQSAARMKELESGLRQRLQDELSANDVEIERLRDQLSVWVLNRILFPSGSAEILPRGRAVLDSVAGAFAGGKETVRIEGHTDDVPIGPGLKDKYFSNWELSAARASSVARYLDDKDLIDPARIEAVGFSKYHQAAPNDTEENRQRNRRVEIVLTPWKPVVREYLKK